MKRFVEDQNRGKFEKKLVQMDEDDKGLEMIDEQFAEEESSISSPASNVSGVVSFQQ